MTLIGVHLTIFLHGTNKMEFREFREIYDKSHALIHQNENATEVMQIRRYIYDLGLDSHSFACDVVVYLM